MKSVHADRSSRAMLRSHKAICCIVRHSQSRPRMKVVGSLQPSAIRQSLSMSSPRYLALSSDEPIRISEDRKNITLHLKDGRRITQKLSPTPKIKSEKLAEGLASILSAPEPNPSDSPSFGTPQWELDPQGDAIHRHIAFSAPEECAMAIQQITIAAEELNHHPHIAHDREGKENCITITCTTHQPRGLSGKDTRLARKINEVLGRIQTPHLVQEDSGNWEDTIRKRETLIGINRKAISVALASCSCSTRKT